MKNSKPLIVYGGDINTKTPQFPVLSYSPEEYLGPETLRRLHTGMNFMQKRMFTKEGVGISYFLFGAGYIPKKLSRLKDRMYYFFKKKHPGFPAGTTPTDGWGTFAETLSLYNALKIRKEESVYVCSSWYHLPRIRFIWWIICKGEIKIHYISAPSPRIYCIFTELIKFIKVFYDWYRWKRTM